MVILGIRPLRALAANRWSRILARRTRRVLRRRRYMMRARSKRIRSTCVTLALVIKVAAGHHSSLREPRPSGPGLTAVASHGEALHKPAVCNGVLRRHECRVARRDAPPIVEGLRGPKSPAAPARRLVPNVTRHIRTGWPSRPHVELRRDVLIRHLLFFLLGQSLHISLVALQNRPAQSTHILRRPELGRHLRHPSGPCAVHSAHNLFKAQFLRGSDSQSNRHTHACTNRSPQTNSQHKLS
mmetsp:Transcript_92978/g.248851  ORF Transcript_92978/g.248851 Transcript_92978/m.248851 type:complete len:241 (+) Transcript_92978:591-1313(+)